MTDARVKNVPLDSVVLPAYAHVEDDSILGFICHLQSVVISLQDTEQRHGSYHHFCWQSCCCGPSMKQTLSDHLSRFCSTLSWESLLWSCCAWSRTFTVTLTERTTSSCSQDDMKFWCSVLTFSVLSQACSHVAATRRAE